MCSKHLLAIVPTSYTALTRRSHPTPATRSHSLLQTLAFRSDPDPDPTAAARDARAESPAPHTLPNINSWNLEPGCCVHDNTASDCLRIVYPPTLVATASHCLPVVYPPTRFATASDCLLIVYRMSLDVHTVPVDYSQGAVHTAPDLRQRRCRSCHLGAQTHRLLRRRFGIEG